VHDVSASWTCTTVFPGRGAIGDKSQLTFYRGLLVGTREKVAAMRKESKSLDEIFAAKRTAARDAKGAADLEALEPSSETSSSAFDAEDCRAFNH
jgi:hypothetical protein